MTSHPSEFKFLKRGFKEAIVLIPGWATDYRIFKRLDLGYNYLLPLKFQPLTFAKDLLRQLNKSAIEKISLFGWSLGGFLAAEFALKNPKRIEELILLSIRKTFDPALLKGIAQKIRENKRAYLYKFYLECFSNAEKEESSRFKKYILKKYVSGMRLEDLLLGLDYLAQAKIMPQRLSILPKIRIFHGEDDKVAPLKEAVEIRSRLPQARFIPMPLAGHIPFLNRNFKRYFNNG